MDRPASVERLVVAAGVDGEGAEEFALLGDDTDLSAGDEEKNRFVAVGGSDADVSEAVNSDTTAPAIAFNRPVRLAD